MNKYTKFCIVLTALLFFSSTSLAVSDLQQLQAKAKGGDAVAQFVLGNHYFTGDGVTQDYKKARTLWAKAAKQQHPDALCGLGIMYLEGKGVQKNIAKARTFFEDAAKLNQADAQCGLAQLYYVGNGTGKDVREAYRWFAASATQGNKDAMFMVGHMLQTGEGVTPKPEMAEIYLHLACQRRQKDACASLAREQGK